MGDRRGKRELRRDRDEPGADEPRAPTGAGHPLLDLQRLVGNRATTMFVQTRLTVGRADDPAERNADDIAAAAMQAISGGMVTAPGEADVQRRNAPVSDDLGGTAVDGEVSSGIESARGAGAGVPTALRHAVESVAGGDLSGVRVHTDDRADALSRSLQAEAFTTGNDIFFRRGAYDPGSSSGRELVAHELAHVVQQGGSTRRREVQRMPSPVSVRSRTQKKQKKGFLGTKLGATHAYNALMDALTAHSKYTIATAIGRNGEEIMEQVRVINSRLDAVVAAANAYLQKDDGEAEVVAVCQELLTLAPIERAVVVDLAAYWRANRNPHGNPKWFTQIPDDPRRYVSRAAAPAAVAAAGGGGGGAGQNKSVSKVQNASGTQGYFAEDGTDGDYGAEYDNPRWLLGQYGVQEDNLRLGARSVAMSRLDRLLGGGVIARTEMAVKGGKLGTFMVDASVNAKTVGDMHADGDNVNDADLARLLSRLQLIDAIAGQIDRHGGNYFVGRDPSGRIVAVTGIDLDMSWVPEGGNNVVDMNGGAHRKGKALTTDWFPGFSRFVDRAMAENIIELHPDDLRVILIDLLPVPYIDAAVNRLVALQALLEGLQSRGELLEPNEWDQQLRARIVNEDKSYFSRANQPGKIGR